MEEFVIVIPARLGSTRLPRKPLQQLKGKPLIVRTAESCLKITEKVIVATDGREVAKALKGVDVEVVMTPSELPSGTDRVFEAVKDKNVKYIINVQGDEPFVKKEHVLPVAKALFEGKAEFATVAVPFSSLEDVQSPHNVKVVRDKNKYALYFSRSLIPFPRDEKLDVSIFLKHVGIYGYTKEALERFVSWNRGKLEEIEKLEQLRILENGEKIYVADAPSAPFGIDTAEDLKKAEKILEKEMKNGF
ncbi:3-deoxy-manno-octulosonate cytidylyltransferase (CMP-KDO synthetase) [Desulfurobacterium pacificum]|uniref:3-deoxy-manno-octulosonate cytidylyltransferase n=1 Tax=Desulfurobacterium pacificum TaxID=240166 RepID=A0ABY1N8Z1_9BACT|nr:3-deoxy-manno-octulosonate cytidylyltransferase [Desulfurobacterium pacificum]SMP02973.1 3-deoxy-manno-octulosonate cytidylyltransferase (CMP-KDO synthetase) [Desulfurobacterium pacificum]